MITIGWPSFAAGALFGALLAVTTLQSGTGRGAIHHATSLSPSSQCSLSSSSLDSLCASHMSLDQLTTLESLPRLITRSSTLAIANYNRTMNAMNALRKDNAALRTSIKRLGGGGPGEVEPKPVTAHAHAHSGTTVIIQNAPVGGKCSHFDCVDSIGLCC
jgi:hypothetical protein